MRTSGAHSGQNLWRRLPEAGAHWCCCWRREGEGANWDRIFRIPLERSDVELHACCKWSNGYQPSGFEAFLNKKGRCGSALYPRDPAG